MLCGLGLALDYLLATGFLAGQAGCARLVLLQNLQLIVVIIIAIIAIVIILIIIIITITTTTIIVVIIIMMIYRSSFLPGTY